MLPTLNVRREGPAWRHAMRCLAASIAGFAVVGLGAPAATAHLQPANSVDTSTNPPEIRYSDQTQWDDARNWSINRFNELNPVNVPPDAWNSVEDVEFKSDNSNNGLCGWYFPDATVSDDIKYYNPSFNNFTMAKRRACAVHELGHAMSLGHISPSHVSATIMDPCPVCSNPNYYTYLQQHDKNDYHAKWGW